MLTKTMAGRFKQTLLLDFHYPFQVELERIILLGGKVSSCTYGQPLLPLLDEFGIQSTV